MYVQRNNEARSRNYCNGKGISITYCECVFVALDSQHAMRMRQIVICGLSAVQYFSTLHKKGTKFEKLIAHEVRFYFLYNFLSETFLILRRTERGMVINLDWFLCKVNFFQF